MSRWITGMSLGLALVSVGCGSDGEDPGFVTSAIRCESACMARDGSCGLAESECLARCQTAEVMAGRLGCMPAHYAALNCSALHADLCGENLSLVCAPEDDALRACLFDGCGANPTDAFCMEMCTTRCEELAYSCGGDASACGASCQLATAQATSRGCGVEFWSSFECSSGLPATFCDSSAFETYCPEEHAALNACAGVTDPDPDPDPGITLMTPIYSACDASRVCSDSTCSEISTETTRGSFCTMSCTSIADCPGQDVACLNVGGPVAYCLATCSTDYDCAEGTYCMYVYDVQTGDSHHVCLPDV